MRLDRLVAVAGDRPGLAGLGRAPTRGADDLDDPTEIAAITLDSRAVEPGALFCCVTGAHTDGHDHARSAVAAGAVALLCERPLDLGVTELRVPAVRRAMGPLAAAFHGDPSSRLDVVGITGTNGKTTTVHLLASILEAAGRPTEVIGTLTATRTTPEAPELQKRLAGALAAGRRAVAMEVSSHALVQHRVDGTRFAVAGFTNLSQDHLDYHGTMESYFQAKAMLFEPALSDRAVVDVDSAHGRLLRDAALVPTVGYSQADATDVVVSADGTSFVWRSQPMHVGLAGRFNLANALCAATIATELGVEVDAVAEGLGQAGPVPGRFELVAAGQPFLVVVDYAHTPDGLAQVLAAARELADDDRGQGAKGRVLVVFGCGGDRDPSKRALMGEVAGAGADQVIITTDNPRSEDPHSITEAVRAGVSDRVAPIVEPDRALAIGQAVAVARPGDVVVIAGKGHETTQIVGTTARPFVDGDVARAAIRGLDR